MKRYISKALRALGFIHLSSITEEDLWMITSNHLSEHFSDTFDKEEKEKLVEKLRDIPEYKEYLTYLSVSDIRRFFQASTPQQQLEARGAYARAIYLKSMLVKKKEEDIAKLKGPRYRV